MTAPVSSDLAWLDDLERACPACAGAMPVHHMGAPLQAAHERHAAAFPTLIAELRKRDAALRAVEELAEKADRKVRESVPASSAERLIAEGAHTVRVGDLRSTLTAALSPESVQS